MHRNNLLRVLAIGSLSAVMVFALWTVTPSVTPGFEIAYQLSPNKVSWIPSEHVASAAIVDFFVWFIALWGVHDLWDRVRMEAQVQGITRHWANPLRDFSTLFDAILCALPFPYYVVLSIAMLVNRGKLPGSTPALAAAIALSLIACSAVVCMLFAIAVRFWPRSNA
jgi:hypothetical protein